MINEVDNKFLKNVVGDDGKGNLGSHTLDRIEISDNDKDYMLKVMSLCTQEAATAMTVGQYTVISGEMVRVTPEDEIHIITNEMYNYDFTPLSSLTISINTMKNVHYYYYGDAGQKRAFEDFKESIQSYYRKSFKARTAVVAWIRKRWSSYINYSDFFSSISGKSIQEIFMHTLIPCGLEVDKVRKIAADFIQRRGIRPNTILISPVIKNEIEMWVDGSDLAERSTRRMYGAISSLKGISDCVKECCELNSAEMTSVVNVFCQYADSLNNMKSLTQWQSANNQNGDDLDINPSDDRIDELLEFFRSAGPQDEVIIPEPLETWLRPEQSEVQCGEIDIDEETINECLQNLHFCLLNDGDPYYLCYNFSLFYCSEGPAACWYITFNESQHAIGSKTYPDVDLFMVDINQNHYLLPRIKAIFKRIIESTPSAKEELKQSRSKVLEDLGIAE